MTGFETYCRERLIELDEEGVPCDARAVLAQFGAHEERAELKAGKTPKILLDESPVRALAARINFQNYDSCKRAFNTGYGLKFGDLGLSSQLLERIQRLLVYRHRTVHVSPLEAMLNRPDVPPEEPEFSNQAFSESARADLDQFIRAIHHASLGLKP